MIPVLESALRRTAPLAAAAVLALGAAACNTAKPAPQMGVRTAMIVAGSPATVLSGLRSEAASQNGRIDSETANTMRVDFGVQTLRIPVPTEYGLWGTRVTWRDTEVHSTALYHVEPCQGGSRVTVFTNPIYWHPDYKQWLPGPFDVPTGFQAVAKQADVQ